MNFFNNINKSVNRLVDLVYPRLCFYCSEYLTETEDVLCVYCKSSLPVLDFSRNYGVISSKFVDVNPKNVICFLTYKKGNITQSLLCDFKYNGDKQIGSQLGTWFGNFIQDNLHISNIDLIVPVPLHKSKERKRGFNQSEIVAKAISEVLSVPCLNALERRKESKTQTRKSRTDRMFNVKDLFSVLDPDLVKGKHILLIDDVITTGSTLAACSMELIKHDVGAISIATLALAK